MPSVFTDTFLKNFNRQKPADPEALNTIDQQHLLDLTTISNGYFSDDDKIKISMAAGERFGTALSKSQAQSYSEVMATWTAVVRDFHQNDHWGFSTQRQPTRVEKPVDENAVKARRFLWTAIQSLVIMKIAILYFGSHYSLDPTPANRNKLIAVILISLTSFAVFFIRNRKS